MYSQTYYAGPLYGSVAPNAHYGVPHVAGPMVPPPQRDLGQLRAMNARRDVLGRTFPAEVLARIFTALPSIWDRIRVTCVCSHWRDVALKAPELWCDIDITLRQGKRRRPARWMVSSYNRDDDEDDARSNHTNESTGTYEDDEYLVERVVDDDVCDLIETFMERAKRRPVALHIPFDPDSDTSKLEARLVSTLTSHWSHIHYISAPMMLDNVVLVTRAPELETFVWRGRIGIGRAPFPTNFISGEPGKLRRLVLCKDVQFPKNCPALSDLTHVEGRWMENASVTRLMELAPRLQHLAVTLSKGHSMRPLKNAQALRSLIIQSDYDLPRDVCGKLLQNVQVANLRRLYVGCVAAPHLEETVPFFDALGTIVEVGIGRNRKESDQLVLTMNDDHGRMFTLEFRANINSQTINASQQTTAEDRAVVIEQFMMLLEEQDLDHMRRLSVHESLLGVLELEPLVQAPVRTLTIYATECSRNRPSFPLRIAPKVPIAYTLLEDIVWQADASAANQWQVEPPPHEIREALVATAITKALVLLAGDGRLKRFRFQRYDEDTDPSEPSVCREETFCLRGRRPRNCLVRSSDRPLDLFAKKVVIGRHIDAGKREDGPANIPPPTVYQHAPRPRPPQSPPPPPPEAQPVQAPEQSSQPLPPRQQQHPPPQQHQPAQPHQPPRQPSHQPYQPHQPHQPIQPLQPHQPIQPLQPHQPIQPLQPLQPLQALHPSQQLHQPPVPSQPQPTFSHQPSHYHPQQFQQPAYQSQLHQPPPHQSHQPVVHQSMQPQASHIASHSQYMQHDFSPAPSPTAQYHQPHGYGADVYNARPPAVPFNSTYGVPRVTAAPTSQHYGVAQMQVQIPTYQHVYQQPQQQQHQQPQYTTVHHMDQQMLSPVQVSPVVYQQPYQQHVMPNAGVVDPFFQPELFGTDVSFFKQEPY